MASHYSRIKKNGSDTGVRTNFRGAMFVDKKVFYRRNDVKNLIGTLKDILRTENKRNKADAV